MPQKQHRVKREERKEGKEVNIVLRMDLFLPVTHSEGVDSGTHFFHVSFHWTELLIVWTVSIPKHSRFEDIAAATIGLEQRCV